MIEDGFGNLLTQDVDALVNTVNTVGVMGKGIALQFKRAYPANFTAYRKAADNKEVRTGEMFVHDSGEFGPRRFIINFPTKEHWRSSSRLADIRSGLVDLVATVRRLEIRSLALPALGCGNGGLAWSDVRPLIEEAFADLPNVRVLVFPPVGPPPASAMPVATAKPRLTVNRAALLVGMDRYLDRARTLAPREGISELETQKVAYFLQVLGQPSRLAFVSGRYGPYAEVLHHVLQELEGHYVAGYGDRSARVTDLQPLQLTAGVAAEAASWLDKADSEATDRISRLLHVVDGFETPYSLELLATAHFAAHLPHAALTTVEVAERVTSWNPRKAKLFTTAHVEVAVSRLSDEQLLPPAWGV